MLCACYENRNSYEDGITFKQLYFWSFFRRHGNLIDITYLYYFTYNRTIMHVCMLVMYMHVHAFQRNMHITCMCMYMHVHACKVSQIPAYDMQHANMSELLQANNMTQNSYCFLHVTCTYMPVHANFFSIGNIPRN